MPRAWRMSASCGASCRQAARHSQCHSDRWWTRNKTTQNIRDPRMCTCAHPKQVRPSPQDSDIEYLGLPYDSCGYLLLAHWDFQEAGAIARAPCSGWKYTWASKGSSHSDLRVSENAIKLHGTFRNHLLTQLHAFWGSFATLLQPVTVKVLSKIQLVSFGCFYKWGLHFMGTPTILGSILGPLVPGDSHFCVNYKQNWNKSWRRSSTLFNNTQISANPPTQH